MQKEEKLLVLSNFFFCHYVFKKPYDNRTDSLQPLRFCIKKNYTFKNRKLVARRHFVLALHDPRTGIFRRQHDDRAANARFSVNLLPKQIVRKLWIHGIFVRPSNCNRKVAARCPCSTHKIARISCSRPAANSRRPWGDLEMGKVFVFRCINIGHFPQCFIIRLNID